MRRGMERPRQPVERERRLVPAAVVQRLQVIDQHAPVEHRLGIAEGKGHKIFLGLSRVVLCGHPKNSMRPVALGLPSSGSLLRMCMHAHAISSWLVTAPRPALKVTLRPEAVRVFLIEMKLPIRSTQPES